MQNRRDFLKLLGLAVGASFTGCGGSGGAGGVYTGSTGGPAPIAYRFVPLANSGAVLPRSSAILTQAAGGPPPFLGAVMLNDLRHVCFHAYDASSRKGVFEIDYDEDGQTSDIKSLLQEGDVLPDGTVVDDVCCGQLNNQDEQVYMVSDAEGLASLQVSREQGAFEEMFNQYSDVSSDCHLDGDLQPGVGLADNGDLLFVCCGKDDEGTSFGEALYYTPKDTAADTVRLISEKELLPNSNCAICSFGFCEIGNDGSYVVQGSAAPVEADTGELPDSRPMSYLACGKPGETLEVLVADPALGISGAIAGSVLMAARLGDSGYGFICQTTPEKTQLYLNRDKLLDAALDGTGSTTPRGERIISFFPPVFGPNGLILVQVFTPKGTEILAYHGQRFSSVLATGDTIGGKRVTMILFGCVPHGINTQGEFVATVDYDDGDSGIVLGLPV